MRILALDTTTARGSVALVVDDDVEGEVRLVSDKQSIHLMPAVSFLLASRGVSARDLDAFAVTIGPGSFTGLRVGISTAQGLAMAAARPCVGVVTLDALASRVADAGRPIVAMMDAYRDEVYARVYHEDGTPAGEPLLGPPVELLALVPPAALATGDGAHRHADAVRRARPDVLISGRSLFLAAAVARLAAARLAAGEQAAPDALRPLYLRNAYALPPRA